MIKNLPAMQKTWVWPLPSSPDTYIQLSIAECLGHAFSFLLSPFPWSMWNALTLNPACEIAPIPILDRVTKEILVRLSNPFHKLFKFITGPSDFPPPFDFHCLHVNSDHNHHFLLLYFKPFSLKPCSLFPQSEGRGTRTLREIAWGILLSHHVPWCPGVSSLCPRFASWEIPGT